MTATSAGSLPRVRATTQRPLETDADTLVVGVFDDEEVSDHGGALQATRPPGSVRSSSSRARRRADLRLGAQLDDRLHHDRAVQRLAEVALR